MKKLKVNYYDSLMTRENNFEPHQAWTMSRAWNPKRMYWIYGGGLQGCAAEPMRDLPVDDVQVTLFTDKDLLSPMVDRVKTRYKVAYISECRSIHPFAYHHALMVLDKFDFIFTQLFTQLCFLSRLPPGHFATAVTRATQLAGHTGTVILSALDTFLIW